MTDEWVEVRDEPQHYRRFENAWARVYDVRFDPGEASLHHRHGEDTFYVAIHPARVDDQTFGEAEVRRIEVPCGAAFCRPHRHEPLIHRIRNVGDGPMRMIGAEIRKSPPVVAAAPLEAPGHVPVDMIFPSERLYIHSIELAPGATTGEIEYGFSGLTVALTETNLAIVDRSGPSRILGTSPGDSVWHDGPLRLSITNLGEAPYRAILAEWR